jgi:hypothetical protein
MTFKFAKEFEAVWHNHFIARLPSAVLDTALSIYRGCILQVTRVFESAGANAIS